MSWFLRGQRKILFFIYARFYGYFFDTVLCEFNVYGQGRGETERITQFCVRIELGASLN